MSDYLAPESLAKEMKNMPQYLPPEVTTLILSRLPVESAVKCTAVCKSWYALIKDPSFISSHLHQAASLQDDFLLLCYLDCDERAPLRTVYDLRRDNDAFEEYKKFPLPSKPGLDGSYIVGTCNGLICLSRVEEGAWNIVLFNPSIRKRLIFPEPDLPAPNSPRERHYYALLGFGFDSASNDYKVLLRVPSDADADADDLAEVWLFSLNRHSWTRLTDDSPKHDCWAFPRPVFVKGALHYGLYLDMILAFNISTESFFVINIPNALVPFAPQMSLIEYEDSIALFNCHGSHELWVMKEYGVDSSWTMVFHSTDKNRGLVFGTNVLDVFGVRKTGRLFLNVSREQELGCELATLELNCHNKEHQKELQLRRVGVLDDFHYSHFGRYEESMVLLDNGEEDVVAEAV
ncbi:unnamed protein product [Cuscuta campestris]|uniref:F-box domain-containing protein n=1 Tax=Cuscuta campestris TaxID=132261 RepID=A0A484L6A3_9ASTE|nr:unnamed protein product [Cuscuta campestris]